MTEELLLHLRGIDISLVVIAVILFLMLLFKKMG